MLYSVYILKSIKFTDEFYIGYTSNLKLRLEQHNTGQSFHTKKYMPWKLVYAEVYANKEDAEDREKKIKYYGKVYAQLKRRINRSLQA